MRRIMVLVTVALVMAAMMAVLSTGAVAQPNSQANACAEAAADPATADPGTAAEFGELASSTAQALGREFGEIIVGLSTGCRQNV
jgi:hypothetical protein